MLDVDQGSVELDQVVSPLVRLVTNNTQAKAAVCERGQPAADVTWPGLGLLNFSNIMRVLRNTVTK